MTLIDAVLSAWARLRDRVEETRDLDFDHEFTLQFHLAWEVARLFRFTDQLGVRFEFPCGRDLDGETIRLDLLLWLDPLAKVAVELKSPLRSVTGKNSPMTNVRMRFFKDIHRLRHLVDCCHEGITSGCFLAVVNERSYVVEGRQSVNPACRTYHDVVIPANTVIPPQPGPNGHQYELRMPPHEIRWDWQCEKLLDGTLSPAKGRRHFWLTPILVNAPRSS